MRKYLMPVLAALAVVGLLSLTAAPASAQYPPPTGGTVALAAEDLAPVAGDTISVAATVVDTAGSPVAGAQCTFAIVSQPGNDASVASGPVTTNADGVATSLLNVGSTGGTIVLEASCGDVASQISVVVDVPEPPPASLPEGPAAPPASQPGQLPSAGFGPGEGASTEVPSGYFFAGVALMLVVAAGTAYLVRRAWLSTP